VHKGVERGFIRAPGDDKNSGLGCIRECTLKKESTVTIKSANDGYPYCKSPKACGNIGHPLTEERMERVDMEQGRRGKDYACRMRTDIRPPWGQKGVENTGVKKSKRVLLM